MQPSVAPSRVCAVEPCGWTRRTGLFFAVWAPALTVAGVVAAVVFAVGSPIAAATVEIRRRSYR